LTGKGKEEMAVDIGKRVSSVIHGRKKKKGMGAYFTSGEGGGAVLYIALEGKGEYRGGSSTPAGGEKRGRERASSPPKKQHTTDSPPRGGMFSPEKWSTRNNDVRFVIIKGEEGECILAGEECGPLTISPSLTRKKERKEILHLRSGRGSLSDRGKGKRGKLFPEERKFGCYSRAGRGFAA